MSPSNMTTWDCDAKPGKYVMRCSWKFPVMSNQFDIGIVQDFGRSSKRRASPPLLKSDVVSVHAQTLQAPVDGLCHSRRATYESQQALLLTRSQAKIG